MIEGAVIALVSLAIGYLAGRRAKKSVAEKPATCACGHVRSMHEGGKGRCMHIDTGDWWWEEQKDGRDRRVYNKVSCPCQHYDGPEPLTTVYAPEIQP